MYIERVTNGLYIESAYPVAVLTMVLCSSPFSDYGRAALWRCYDLLWLTPAVLHLFPREFTGFSSIAMSMIRFSHFYNHIMLLDPYCNEAEGSDDLS